MMMGLTILIGIAFWIFRTQTHFLGDGYTLLSLLASENPLIKNREMGESLIHIWTKNTFGAGTDAAMSSYRFVAIASGLTFLATTAYFSTRIFKTNTERWTYFLGLSSGGYMLMFFGYVENYSVFILAVAMFAQGGILLLRTDAARWWVLPPLVLSIFLHIFGVTLIPAAIYLMTVETRLHQRWRRLPTIARRSIMGMAIGMMGVTFGYYYSNDLFFKLAIVPLIPHQLTPEGYTLLSLDHMIDMLNLILILLPAVLIYLFLCKEAKIARQLKQPPIRFLLVAVIGTLGAAFIFDPKIGMPRDWDLFAFAGVPLAVLIFYSLLQSAKRHRIAVILMIVLGWLSLSTRLTVVNDSGPAIAQAESFLKLDTVKNKYLRYLIAKLYEEQGDSLLARAQYDRWNTEFPERVQVQTASVLLGQGRVKESIDLTRKALATNPHLSDGWSNLATGYSRLGRHDSALVFLEIATALSPYSAINWSNMGSAYLSLSKLEDAEECLSRSIAINPELCAPYYHLAYVYGLRKQWGKYGHYLSIATTKENAPAEYFSELGDYHVRAGFYRNAAMAYKKAIELGLDSSHIEMVYEQFPQLKSWMKR